jgi:hypothetical protein
LLGSQPQSCPPRRTIQPSRNTHPAPTTDESGLAATAVVMLYLREIVGRVFPEADAEAMATATWALVHGLACLHLDGKLDASTPAAVADRVAAAIHALLSATIRGEDLGDG